MKPKPLRLHPAFLTVGLSLLPACTDACPVCATETGQQVRAGLFDGRFGVTALLVLLPFPILLFGAMWLHRALTPRPESD